MRITAGSHEIAQQIGARRSGWLRLIESEERTRYGNAHRHG
jgi:hypothetical protein